jgi:hypothetical protein
MQVREICGGRFFQASRQADLLAPSLNEKPVCASLVSWRIFCAVKKFRG